MGHWLLSGKLNSAFFLQHVVKLACSIFYEALAKGESIQQCFDTAATNEDVLFHDVTPHKYRLLPKDSDHNDTVFSSASSTSTASSTGPTEVLSKSTCNSLPKLPKYYIEQKQVVNDVRALYAM